ncbi:MaoC family dehydratase [Rhodococcus sp. (in: high G+C Gram-positive bacteria)]|uniref:MaoC family dehydratase n=1 Tax=Rhodococcus sp. TaxID=1831 RepID=UPI00257BF749|nr:MaoC family dehydratase [Rhodococcus sp. (in: high G+C Gram-positive bacteria)]MBQ9056448.1 MaoC family dehydratase [Rhodococcus sp. (in: high G+C Gram-positive bacteria)]
MTIFNTLDEVSAAVGADLGVSRWIDITQDRINAFADTTEDRQWIHTDPVAAAAGPYGTTVAHGFLSLSLLAAFSEDLLIVEEARTGVNYGLNKVRFPAPVPVDSKVRGRGKLAAVDQIPGGIQVTMVVSVEREGSERPVCVGEFVLRLLA